MLNDFLTFINQKELGLAPTDRILLTVSGGIDSMAMLRLFKESGLNFGVAHCNFQLRGEASDGDEQFVQQTVKHLNVPCFVQRFETKKFAKQKGVSTQMAARELRYEWFEEIRNQNNYQYIATAHHQDDVLETILLNLTKGTGLAGLHGILPKNGHIVRPMLFTNRDSIEIYAKETLLEWREDASNEDTHYQRNLIRKKVVPILKQINPNISKSTSELAKRVWASEKIIDIEIEKIRKEIQTTSRGVVYLNYQKLESHDNAVEVLAQMLKYYDFDYKLSETIWQNKDTETGKRFLSKTHILTKDREQFVISKAINEEFEGIEIDKSQSKVVLPNGFLELSYLSEKIDFVPHVNVSYIDASKLKFPLKVRRWQNGDVFCPLGMNGKRKKVSDLLIDMKIPRNLKDNVLVLESDGKIVWVIGIRLDENFKISEKSKNILKIFNF
jgi:tRNA(Ile)-lysidine synthase